MSKRVCVCLCVRVIVPWCMKWKIVVHSFSKALFLPCFIASWLGCLGVMCHAHNCHGIVFSPLTLLFPFAYVAFGVTQVVVLGDTCDAGSMVPLALGADVVVHEATNTFLSPQDQVRIVFHFLRAAFSCFA